MTWELECRLQFKEAVEFGCSMEGGEMLPFHHPTSDFSCGVFIASTTFWLYSHLEPGKITEFGIFRLSHRKENKLQRRGKGSITLFSTTLFKSIIT